MPLGLSAVGKQWGNASNSKTPRFQWLFFADASIAAPAAETPRATGAAPGGAAAEEAWEREARAVASALTRRAFASALEAAAGSGAGGASAAGEQPGGRPWLLAVRLQGPEGQLPWLNPETDAGAIFTLK